MMHHITKLPTFSLQNDREEWISSDHFKGRYVVLFFFPKAFTPGCTKECIAFSAIQPTFTLDLKPDKEEEAIDSLLQSVTDQSIPDVLWIGISRDSPATMAKFRDKHGLTIDLLSDDGALSKSLDVQGIGGTVKRSTFIIDRWGTIRERWDKVKVNGHDTEVSESLLKIMRQDQSIMPAIADRRAYRGIRKDKIDLKLLQELMHGAHLAPSCMNNQPWHYEVISDDKKLKEIHAHLPEGNSWMTQAPVIVAVHGELSEDCQLSDQRDYLLFDLGLSTGFLMLQATHMGLVAHPAAGYDPQGVKSVLEIPESHRLITLVAIGYQSDGKDLSEKNQRIEQSPRKRRELDQVVRFW